MAEKYLNTIHILAVGRQCKGVQKAVVIKQGQTNAPFNNKETTVFLLRAPDSLRRHDKAPLVEYLRCEM